MKQESGCLEDNATCLYFFGQILLNKNNILCAAVFK
jgi:hypothetical protein